MARPSPKSSPRKELVVVDEAERAGVKLPGTGRDEEEGERMEPLLKAAEKLPAGEGASR